MELTKELKREIDLRSHMSLLRQWRSAPAGTPIFEGESGKYFGERMAEMRNRDNGAAVADSKAIG